MNKLYIIGNGFDLAHGLKTSYKDFLLWYIKKCVASLSEKHECIDDIISITRKEEYQYTVLNQSVNTDAFNSVIDVLKFLDGKNSFWNYQIPSPFFRAILKNENANWVNIENIYYQFLSGLVEEKQSEKSLKAISYLNDNMDFIREELIKYIKENCCEFQIDVEQTEYHEILSQIDYYEPDDEGAYEGGFADSYRESNSLFVNFNYTPLVKQYFDAINTNDGQFDLIQIHGSIENPESIVFGFGDELDDVYHEMERKNNNEYFKHIKSFKYFQDENYQRLMSFIDGEEEFEVIVLGHSLGLSDRTMLAQIFEHKNLKKVQLYYYQDKEGNNDFTEKTYEISRHFSDKGRMRLKVVNRQDSKRMPQVELQQN